MLRDLDDPNDWWFSDPLPNSRSVPPLPPPTFMDYDPNPGGYALGPDVDDIPPIGGTASELKRKFNWWKMPTTLKRDDIFSVGVPDYIGRNLGDGGNALYNHLTDYGGGGFMRGIQAVAQLGPDATWEAKRDAFRGEQEIAAKSRAGLKAAGTTWKDYPGAVAKQVLNQYIEGVDFAVNSWHPDNWDSFGDVVKDIGDPKQALMAKRALNATGKVLLTAAPLMDVVDFGLRVGEGQNVARAGLGTVGGIGGFMAGATVGAAVSGPFAPVGGLVGGIIGSMIGDAGLTKGYELVTEDAWEKTAKLRNRGINLNLDQVKQLESQGYSINADNGFASRGGEMINLAQPNANSNRQAINASPQSMQPQSIQPQRNISSRSSERFANNMEILEQSNRQFQENMQRLRQNRNNPMFETGPLF